MGLSSDVSRRIESDDKERQQDKASDEVPPLLLVLLVLKQPYNMTADKDVPVRFNVLTKFGISHGFLLFP
jgi:arginine utilization protein RocB